MSASVDSGSFDYKLNDDLLKTQLKVNLFWIKFEVTTIIPDYVILQSLFKLCL